MNIIDYLDSNNISVGTEHFKKENVIIDKVSIYNQIRLISEVQRIFIKNKKSILPPIDSTIGRELEGFKVKIKRLKRYLNELNYKYNNSFNNYLIEELNSTIERAELTLNSIDNDKYIELIKRSMSNNEVCLGKVDEGNLKKSGRSIQIKSTKYLSCNLIEHDCYNYIKRLKKRGYISDLEEIIIFFTNIQHLDIYSKEYIVMLANYPIESIKTFLRVKEDKDVYTEEQWINAIEQSKSIDGNDLL